MDRPAALTRGVRPPDRRAALVALVAVGAAVATAGSAYHRGAPAPRRIIGVSANPGSPGELALLEHLGIRRVRWTLYWNTYLDSRRFAADGTTPVVTGGRTVAERFDADYRAGVSAGLDQLIVVHTPPAGMTLRSGVSAMPAFMAARARQYPGTTWQILNEMDGEDGFNGGWFAARSRATSQYERGRSYGTLLGAVALAIRHADATAGVVAGGIALDPSDFLRGMLETCNPSLLTAVAIHAYGMPSIRQFRSKGIAARANARGLPVWVTEFGSGITNATLQRAELGMVLDDYDSNRRFDRAYLYSLTSRDGYGITDADGTMRPAANLLMNRTAP